MEAKAGDRVEVHLAKSEYSGILLESPESGIVLVKLDTGYNIGLNKKDVLKIDVLEEGKEVEKDVELKNDKNKPNVAMIVLGGTIASRLNPGKGGVDFVEEPSDLFKYYPGLFDKVNISKVEVPFMKGSENMDYKDWQKVAKVCEKYLEDGSIEGILITQGTDTLHYTSAALSFFLGEVSKPVVLTYSQRSIDRASSDADLNLQCAALACISEIAEVMVVGHASTNDDFCYALAGTKVRKMHSSRRDAFKGVNRKPFAKIDRAGVTILSEHRVRGKGKRGVKIDTRFEEKVALVKFYPGQDPDILDYYVDKGYKGIVIEMAGLGHVATSGARLSWIKKLKDVQSKGLVICAAAQTINGRLDPLVYVTGRELIETGIIYLEDMLSETAFVKLGWVLGHKDWNVREKMLENFSWELNDRLEE
ncbi:Glu-tRNA(Gln) amidotransferase subunit GatD [archaeon]|jgi:glutamyl-tRNA(Gln) amidotransferase subunit D|nr:Glu-tRNA(Gln) amidotransferase subunit GatD [archaeon]